MVKTTVYLENELALALRQLVALERRSTKLGAPAGARLLEGIVNGSLSVEPFTVADAARCRELLAKYEDLDLGLADASVVATAERLGVLRILTVDERDFRPIRTSAGKAFALVPADERRPGGSKLSYLRGAANPGRSRL